MSLSAEKVKKVLSLQQEYFSLEQQVTFITEQINNLLEHKCDITYQVTVHDKDQCAENTKERESDEVLNGDQRLMSFLSGGFIKAPGAIKQQPCRQLLVFTCKESTGIRIFNALLQEKQEQLEVVQKQIDEILIPQMKIVVDEIVPNPINDLHK